MAQHVGVDSDRIPFFEVFNVKKTLKLFDAFAFNFKCIIPMRYLQGNRIDRNPNWYSIQLLRVKGLLASM